MERCVFHVRLVDKDHVSCSQTPPLFFLRLYRTGPVTGARQQSNDASRSLKKNMQRVLWQRDTWRESVKPAVIAISRHKTSRVSAVHAALPQRSSAQPHVEATNKKHPQVQGQSEPTFADGGAPEVNKVACHVSEKLTAGQAQTCLGSALGRFRVPIGATNHSPVDFLGSTVLNTAFVSFSRATESANLSPSLSFPMNM